MQRYFTNKIDDNKFLLNDDDIYHIKTVMRMKNSDKIEVVFQNKVYEGIIDNDFIIKGDLLSDEVKLKEITLIIPLLKETKMDLILQKATELGISNVIPVKMERSIIKLDNKDFVKKQSRWQRICKEASEQSKRTSIPKVCDLKTIEELDLQGLNIMCSTLEKQNTLKTVLKNNTNCDKINIVVGPEGGFTKQEEEKLIKKGFIPTTLGKLIMRVETVPIYLLSILNYEME